MDAEQDTNDIEFDEEVDCLSKITQDHASVKNSLDYAEDSERNSKEDTTETIKCQHPSLNLNEQISDTDATVYKNILLISVLHHPDILLP